MSLITVNVPRVVPWCLDKLCCRRMQVMCQINASPFGLPHIWFVRLLFLARIVFFFHNNSARTVFFSQFQQKFCQPNVPTIILYIFLFCTYVSIMLFFYILYVNYCQVCNLFESTCAACYKFF